MFDTPSRSSLLCSPRNKKDIILIYKILILLLLIFSIKAFAADEEKSKKETQTPKEESLSKKQLTNILKSIKTTGRI